MKPQTIVIDNFTGSLTRTLNGPLNSGLAQYVSSFGYNPFIYPKNLTWTPSEVDITSTLNGLVLAGKPRIEGTSQFLYAITSTGHFVKINTSTDAITDLHTLSTGSPTFNYGSSLLFFNGKVWITNDKGLSRIDFDGTNETQVGTWDSSHFIQDTFHPLTEFQGQLLIGNTTDGTSPNIGTVDTTNLITNYNKLSPAFPIGTYVKDMDIYPDLSYVTFSVSEIPPENLTPGNDALNAFTGDTFLFKWNGTDIGITAGVALPNFGVTALNYFGDSAFTFMYDFLGAALYDGTRKILTLSTIKSPLPNATVATGNLVFFLAPDSGAHVTLYAYGKLDDENPAGLWALSLISTNNGSGSSTKASSVPFISIVINQIQSLGSNGLVTSIPNKLYFSIRSVLPSVGTVSNRFYSLSIPVDTGAALTPPSSVEGGFYYTQAQQFENKISISQVRVYCDPTVAGNSFELLIEEQDGNNLFDDSYTFVAGSDVTKLEGSLDRINFNPNIDPVYGFYIALLNTGTTQMIIRKIEVDWTYAGK